MRKFWNKVRERWGCTVGAHQWGRWSEIQEGRVRNGPWDEWRLSAVQARTCEICNITTLRKVE